MRFIITDCCNNSAHSKRIETHSETSNLIFNFPNECVQIRLITAWKYVDYPRNERMFRRLGDCVECVALKATKCCAEWQEFPLSSRAVLGDVASEPK